MSAVTPISTGVSTPSVMRAAVSAYNRARRARRLGLAALGGGGVALAAAAGSGVIAFLVGRRLRRR